MVLAADFLIMPLFVVDILVAFAHTTQEHLQGFSRFSEVKKIKQNQNCRLLLGVNISD